MKNLHIALKFPNKIFEINKMTTDTISEHKKTLKEEGRVIWGQMSKSKSQMS